MRTALRATLPAIMGVVVMLGTMTAYCDASGGAPSWERCQSWLGNPIIEWPGGNFSPLFALALGFGVGFLVWWFLGRSQTIVRVTAGVVVLGVVGGLTPFAIRILTI